MATGIAGLDYLCGGGIVRGNSLLIEGPPGSGKSTVGVRIIAEGILRYDEPGLIVTFEEFPKQIYQEARQTGLDLQALEAAGKLRVLWTSPSRIVDGFTGKNDLVDKIVEEMGTRRILIDSVTHFRRVTTSEDQMRDLLASVLSNLKIKNVNALLVKELSRVDDEAIAYEEYLVDASLRLYNTPNVTGSENMRQMEVRKTRGQPHVSGRHPFELGPRGPVVFPRLRIDDVKAAFPKRVSGDRHRVSTGVTGLDGMLHGGMWSRSLTIVSGQPGTGKSVAAYHFLEEGIKSGEPGVLLSVRSPAEHILAQAASLGIEWDAALESGLLRIVHFPPSGLCVERMENELLRQLRRNPPARLVFDSIDDLWSVLRDPDRVRDHVLLLATLFEAAGTTSIMMHELRARSAAGAGSDQDYGYLADCVLQLTIVEEGSDLRRFVRVKKIMDSDHDKSVREYAIDHHGIHITGCRADVTPPIAAVG